MNRWYVLYVKRGSEQDIADRINELGTVEAFVPRRIKFHKRAGQQIRLNEPIFTSYVFVETELEYEVFYVQVLSHVKLNTAYFKTLSYRDKNVDALLPQEKDFLLSLMDKTRTIGESTGLVEGDTVTILDGPLKGQQSAIVKIDRHKQCATLRLSLMGRPIDVRVALNLVYKDPLKL
jgi:transcription termination/antitermination protein NusG